MKRILAILPILVLGLIGAWEIRDYEQLHKPMAAKMWRQFEFEECVRNCEDDQRRACEQNGVAPDRCVIDCSRCRKYLDEEGE